MSSNTENEKGSGSMTVAEAGRKGGKAPHEERGLQAADEQTRKRVAHAGGETVREAFQAKRKEEGTNK